MCEMPRHESAMLGRCALQPVSEERGKVLLQVRGCPDHRLTKASPSLTDHQDRTDCFSYLQSLEDRARGDQLPGLRPTSPKRAAISPPQSTARSVPQSGRATSASTRRPSPARNSHVSARTPVSASRVDPAAERLCVPTFDQEEYEYSPNDSAHNVFISNPLVDNGETFAMDPTGKYCEFECLKAPKMH